MMVFDGNCKTEGDENNRQRERASLLVPCSALNLSSFSANTKTEATKTAFEGEEYYKHDVTATLLPREDGERTTEGSGEEEGEQISTFLYCWSESSESACAQLLPEDWDYPSFREEHLSRYVEMCAGFEEELREEARAASAAARSISNGGGEYGEGERERL